MLRTLIVESDKTGEKAKITISAADRQDNVLRPALDFDPIADMSLLCEAVCTMIHAIESEGIQDSATSVRECLKHITDGFADASYVGKINRFENGSN